ncbi:MAG: undecaprenyl/decaprenyl-phosphate alpha-N-acetylglucosaminyl 1-phosphate transferase [Burkholderiales bacterium]|nr:undecaprenyl/decaprenyl-phosphate alpha-N-acetylglucosaminyl 1-phosphate transferase [Burkholderiales bacterium]
MTALLAMMTALVISISLTPLMIRLAPRMRMVDLPDPRKVHLTPIPRVGGLGIAVGTLTAIMLFVPIDGIVGWYLFGAAVLLVFGAADDSMELGHWVKFVGQFIAVIPIVHFGDLWVTTLPVFDIALSPWIGKPFTVIAIVGVINAINHSDGLDGLASGEALMSFAAIAYLGFLAGDGQCLAIAAAAAGGILGFLRFNTHPARVFMGDAGSQFIGYTLGVMVVLLTQKVNPALSMAIPALLLGLPIVDIIAVFAQRIHGGMNWFKASRNHIHHRLLAIGFQHYQAVLIIYTVQAVMVVNAVNLAYESDLVIIGLYLALSALVFIALIAAERTGWRADVAGRSWLILGILDSIHESKAVAVVPRWLVFVAVPAFMVVASFSVNELAVDSKVALALVALLLVAYVSLRKKSHGEYLSRLAVYALIPLLVWSGQPGGLPEAAEYKPFTDVFFIALGICVLLAAKFAADRDQFAPNTMDFLLLLFVVIAGFVLSSGEETTARLGSLLIQVVVLFYGCELIMRISRAGAQVLSAAAAVSLVAIALRAAG